MFADNFRRLFVGNNFSKTQQPYNGNQDIIPQKTGRKDQKRIKQYGPDARAEPSKKLGERYEEISHRYYGHIKYNSPYQPVSVELPDEFIEFTDQYGIVVFCHEMQAFQGTEP